MSTYKVQVEHRFCGFKYMKTFTVIGHFTEVAVGQIIIRPRLVVQCVDGKTRVFSGIDSRDFIVIGGLENGAQEPLGSRGEQTPEG
jgi:hypothetical protein